MDTRYTEVTRMLNYKSRDIQELICTRKWNELDEYQKIKANYEYV